MGVYVGIDVGTVSLKIGLIGDDGARGALSLAARDSELFYRPPDDTVADPSLSARVLVTRYARIKGNPVLATRELLGRVIRALPEGAVDGGRVCGSGGKLVGQMLGVNYENDFRAVARGSGGPSPLGATSLALGGPDSTDTRA